MEKNERELTEHQKAMSEFIRTDRDQREKKEWHGNVLEYMDLVKANPSIAKLAHARLYDIVIRAGAKDIQEIGDNRTKRLYKDEPVKVYNFFADEFFGIEKTLSQVVRYLHAGSLRGEESRQVLYLMGPVGSGKSSLVEKFYRGLEASEPFYAIEGCPMFNEPLLLLPKHLREEILEKLGLPRKFFKPDWEICPVCRFRLKNEFNGRWEEMPVAKYEFSKRARIGIGIVPPVDPNNQDTSVLIGSEDISKLDMYSEGDPRVLELNGALNVGNRGLVEFIEVFKNEIEYLHCMITATQEKVVPAPGRHGLIYTDTVIMAHSNEAEWQKFRADHTNEAILDRIVVIKVPYNLRVSEEVKIYQKIIRTSDFRAHVAPHTLEVASMFAILSRLEPTNKCDLMTKLHLYNGEEVVEKGRTKKVDFQELKEAAKREGMQGISTRFIMKALDNALSDSGEGNCINPISVREALINMVKEADLPDDTRKQYLEFLQDMLHKAYLELLEKEVTRAFVYSYQEQAESLFQTYLDHAEAHVNKTKVKDRNTKEDLVPDEKLMKSIEEQIAIMGSAADGFRQEVVAFMFSAQRRGEKIDYKSYEPLKEAIEKKLMTSVRDLSRIITKARTRDKEQGDKYDAMVKKLLDDGYCLSCVDVVLKYAANNLWKD